MAVLPIDIPFSLTEPPWKPASGPQNTVGGPVVYSHVAFVGGLNGGDMIVVGGVMSDTDGNSTSEERTAYSYDCNVGRWNSFSLPNSDYLNRQDAAVATASDGVAYVTNKRERDRVLIAAFLHFFFFPNRSGVANTRYNKANRQLISPCRPTSTDSTHFYHQTRQKYQLHPLRLRCATHTHKL